MKKDYFLTFLIILITAISRLIFFEQDFGGLSYDSGSFSLAAQSYDISETRPHLPGYYLHIQSIKLLSIITGSSHSAMKWLTILYSSMAAGIFYLLLRRWFTIKISILVCCLTFTNMMIWFFACVTEIYAFDLFFSVALVFLGLSSRTIIILPFFIGFFSGVRPSSGILLMPLYLFLWYRCIKTNRLSVSQIIGSHVLGIIGGFLWLIPMLESAGGLSAYISLYSTHYPVEKISLAQNLYRLSSYMVFIAFPFPVLIVFRFFQKKTAEIKSKDDQRDHLIQIPKDFLNIMLWWLIPPLLVFFFFHYNEGYFLICGAPFFGLTILFFKNRSINQWALISAIIGQILFFSFISYSFPSAQTYFAREKRSINLAQVWWERTRSVFLMAQSHIRALEDISTNFEKAVILDQNRSEDLSQKFVFLDPTFPISARSMQVKYPELTFTTFAYRKKNGFRLFSGLEKSLQQGFDEMLKKSIVVSRKEFVSGYLKSLPLKIHQSDSVFTIFSIPDKTVLKVSVLYDSLFSRIK